MSSQTRSAGRGRLVLTLFSLRILPCSSTRAALMLVPPRFTPMVFIKVPPSFPAKAGSKTVRLPGLAKRYSRNDEDRPAASGPAGHTACPVPETHGRSVRQRSGVRRGQPSTHSISCRAVSRPRVQFPRWVSGRAQMWVMYQRPSFSRKQACPLFCRGFSGASHAVSSG